MRLLATGARLLGRWGRLAKQRDRSVLTGILAHRVGLELLFEIFSTPHFKKDWGRVGQDFEFWSVDRFEPLPESKLSFSGQKLCLAVVELTFLLEIFKFFRGFYFTVWQPVQFIDLLWSLAEYVISACFYFCYVGVLCVKTLWVAFKIFLYNLIDWWLCIIFQGALCVQVWDVFRWPSFKFELCLLLFLCLKKSTFLRPGGGFSSLFAVFRGTYFELGRGRGFCQGANPILNRPFEIYLIFVFISEISSSCCFRI